MNKLIIFTLSIFWLLKLDLEAQTYTINSGGSISTCSGTIYDSGGSGSSYSNNENYTMTFCSSSGNCLSVVFSTFDVEDNYDKLSIYDGPTTAYALIGNFDNGNPPTTINSTTGCLTFKFTSDVSTVGNFAATINCSSCPVPPTYNNPKGFIYSCNALFYDSGGPSVNYGNNQNRTTKFCSNTSNCVIATFTSFNTEASVDILTIYDGNSTAASILGTYSGTNSPGVVTSSTGCLTFKFNSDAYTRGVGWSATISCGTCGTPPPPNPQNCAGATTVCGDQLFSGNSSGSGSVTDLTSSNEGCLFGENQSSWYYISPSSNGVVELNISPSNGTDDYDFAIWGPMSTITCPPASSPLRCSFAAGGGNTGLRNASIDNSENSFGDGFVSSLNVIAGEKYILLVDNYSESTQPFTLDWTLSGGASLNCTPLPIELLKFSGKNVVKYNLIEWKTSTEINNDYFTLERSENGVNFENLTIIEGAGNSNQLLHYQTYDDNPFDKVTYYRLKQTDFNGEYSYSTVIAIYGDFDKNEINNIHPNPTSGNLNFDINLIQDTKINIEVYDFLGRIILTEIKNLKSGKSSENIVTENLEKGIYLLKIKIENSDFEFVEKIIKN